MSNQQKKNPLIDQYNYWHPYQQSIEKLKQSNPETVVFAKLCYEVFDTDAGKKLMEMLEQKYLIPTIIQPGISDYETMSVYANGFKDGLLLLRKAMLSHKQYIKDHNKE